MIGCDLLSALIVALMASSAVPVWALLALLFLLGLISPVAGGMRNRLLVVVLPAEAFIAGRSLFRIVAQSAQVVGNAAGGLLIALTSPRGALLLDCVSFLGSALVVRAATRARAPLGGEAGEMNILRDSLAGASAVLSDPRIRRVLLLGWLVPTCAVAPEALAAPYVAHLGLSEGAAGWWLAAIPTGMLVGELVAIWFVPPAWRLRLIGVLAASTFVPLLAFAVEPGLALALPLLVVSGLCGAWILGQDALILEVTPERLLGRVFSVNQAGLISLQGLGFALAGALGEVVEPHVAIVIAAVTGLALVAALAPGHPRSGRPGWRRGDHCSRATLSRGLRRPERPHSMFLRRTPIVLALVAALAAPLAASADTTFTFTGHGYGHGVGMGQYGAQGYALQGWTHQQILAHYYQGTTLGTSPVTQVRVLLQEKLTQAAAGAPGGLTAADEGGSATLPIAGPSVVTVRKDASGFSLVDATGAVLASGWTGPVSLTATGGGPVTLSGAGLNGVRDGRYRGRLRVLAGADGLAVVNVVTLESYLLGVVASEMPSDWKPEALEAQAIAARTYAVATRKPASSPYDLYPDQRSQVYRGLAGEGAPSSAAVDATAGQVVLYQGQPIVTYFSSSSGGRTAAVQESLPGVDPEPYLVSVDDPFDTISPYHDWTLSLDDRDLSQKAVYPGLITGVQINAYPSGRVNTVTFNGSAGPLVLSASLVRKRLGLRSTWFTVDAGGARRENRCDRAALARRARPRAAHGQRATWCGDPAGRWEPQLARHRHASRGR